MKCTATPRLLQEVNGRMVLLACFACHFVREWGQHPLILELMLAQREHAEREL